MPKHYPVNEAPTSPESAEPGDVLPSASAEPGAVPSFWILKDATARKIGKRSEGNISYRLLADADRQHLFIAITGNASSGYFSREKVPFQRIRECLSSFPNKAFPSKALRDAFVGRSSNNPPFMAGILADLELIAADATTESLHKAIGDWPAFEQAMLALPGNTASGRCCSSPAGDRCRNAGAHGAGTCRNSAARQSRQGWQTVRGGSPCRWLSTIEMSLPFAIR